MNMRNSQKIKFKNRMKEFTLREIQFKVVTKINNLVKMISELRVNNIKTH